MGLRKDILLWGAVSVASLGSHVAAFGGLARLPDDHLDTKRTRVPTLVEMAVAPPTPHPPFEPAKAEAPAVKHVVRAHRAPAAKPASEPLPSEAPAQAETPADFTGVTLTNSGPGPGWSSATGSGDAMRGPIGTPGAKVTGRSRAGSDMAGVRDTGPAVVGLADLSRAPQSPDLADALERFYPPEARRSGLAGKAVVRARVMPDGHIADLAVVTETTGGFGEACKNTLRGSQWTPPVDRSGRLVSTFIMYNCRFEVL